MNDSRIGQAIAEANYAFSGLYENHIGLMLACLVISLGIFGLTPLKIKSEFNALQVLLVYYRKIALISLVVIMLVTLGLYAFYVSMNAAPTALASQYFVSWLWGIAKINAPLIGGGLASALLFRLLTTRYLIPWVSGIWRRLRVEQTNEKLDDIRERSDTLKAVDYIPNQHYSTDHVFLGLSDELVPITVSDEVWNETNKQIIGPTRYGKGVLIGCILDQQIRKGAGTIYVDPKGDRYAPHIMCRAAQESGRQFIYLDLSDNGIGSWAPFRGGTERDALTRLEMAFDLEYTGETADFYKGQERKALDRAFKSARDVPTLRKSMENTDSHRINAELARWSSIRSLCPGKDVGFDMDRALLDNAVIYVKGSLDDSIIKTATTIFIAEIIQASRRLDRRIPNGVDVVIDEVSSLVSSTLALSLATSVGFGVRFTLAYQSQGDLLNIENTTVSGRYVYQSINVNSQIKAVYGGADHETAQWIADLSGTVMKSVPKMERSEINASGGEVWAGTRFMGTEEANLISINTVLALPPRVGVLVSPSQLARLCFTAFVPVDTEERLEQFLNDQKALEATDHEPEIEELTGKPDKAENKRLRSEAAKKMSTATGVVTGSSADKQAAELEALEKTRAKRRERNARQKQTKQAAKRDTRGSGKRGDGKSVGAVEGQG